MKPTPLFLPLLLLLPKVHTLNINFPFESLQLTDRETEERTEIAFGDRSNPRFPSWHGDECKPFPGDVVWPSPVLWEKLNGTLGGVLIRPTPPAQVCYVPYYDAQKCAYVRQNFANTTFHTEDPGSVISQWEGGSSCLLPTNGTVGQNGDVIGIEGECRRGGMPEYVIRVGSVRDVQVGVNWARNMGVRLVVKNTGHDFLGKSQGAGSLSIWVHHLKSTEFLPSHTTGSYTGPVARIAAGIQTFELNRFAASNGITILGPGGSTVGVAGGFLQGGGHSTLSSLYGLAADQVLEINIVTADGKFVTASEEENQELFWAVRGGGGGTWGIITSILVRTYPQTRISSLSLSFTNDPSSPTGVNNTTFWKAVQAYWAFSPEICDNGGIGYNFIRHSPSNPSILTLTTSLSMGNLSNAQTRALVTPLFNEFKSLGLNLDLPSPVIFDIVNLAGPGELNIGTARTATRLLPRKNFEDSTLLAKTSEAIKQYVEGGYYFHGIQHCPLAPRTFAVNNSVLPSWRTAAMHSEAYDNNPATGASIATQKASYARFRQYFQGIVDVAPHAGSYMNEADVGETEWQRVFFGENYARLLGVKGRWDPWGLFWVVRGVGSEGWEVRAPGGLPTGDGRLCRVGGGSE